jgi:dUTPase
MESARSNSRQLIRMMLEAIRSCTTELDVHWAMFGLMAGEENLDELISGMVTRLHDRVGSWDNACGERGACEKMDKAAYTGWWTGARMLFGNYLPYSDGGIGGRRRLGRGVADEGVWPDIIADMSRELGMRVTTRLNWYRCGWDTKVLNVLMDLIHHPLAGSSTNDQPRGNKDAYLHASMRATRAGLCLKDLASVATVGSAGVDVVAVGIEQVTPCLADEEAKEEERIELFHQVEPLYFDTVLLRKGAEYRVYTGLTSDIPPKWSLFVMPKSGQMDWDVVVGLVDGDYKGEIQVRIIPRCDIRLNRLGCRVGQLVPVKTGTSLNIAVTKRKRLDDAFSAADL